MDFTVHSEAKIARRPQARRFVWEDMIAESLAKVSDPALAHSLLRAKIMPKPIYEPLLRYALRLVDENSLPFAQASWSEMIDLGARQLAENLAFANPDVLEAYPGRQGHPLRRPASKTTLAQWVQLAERHVGKSQPILVIDDYDFLSMQLMKAGFQNVTFASGNMALLSEVSRLAGREGYPLQVCAFDRPESLQFQSPRHYKLIFGDPVASRMSLAQLLSCMVGQTPEPVDPVYVVRIDLGSLLKAGLYQFKMILRQMELEVLDLHLAANVHRATHRGRVLLKVFAGAVFPQALPWWGQSKQLDRWFSDTLVLRSQLNSSE